MESATFLTTPSTDLSAILLIFVGDLKYMVAVRKSVL